MGFFKFVLFPVIVIVIGALGIKEYTTYVSARAESEEAPYFRRRLIRRLVGLGLLLIILILIVLHSSVSDFLGSAGMNLLYLLGCLVLTLVIFVLILIDVKETGEMIMRNQHDLARNSISSLRQRVKELQKTDSEQQTCPNTTAQTGRQTNGDTQGAVSRRAPET